MVPFPSGLHINQKPDIVVKPFKRNLVKNLSSDPENEMIIEIIDGRDRRLELSFMQGFEEELTSVSAVSRRSFSVINILFIEILFTFNYRTYLKIKREKR